MYNTTVNSTPLPHPKKIQKNKKKTWKFHSDIARISEKKNSNPVCKGTEKCTTLTLQYHPRHKKISSAI